MAGPQLRAVLVGVFLAACACLLVRPFWSHDTWWHIKCGELIVKEHTWPSPDRFTCTVNGEPWLVHSWVSQCVMYLADRALGETGLQLLGTGMRLIFALLVWRLSANLSRDLAVRLLVTANAAFFCAALEYRPHLVVPILLTLMVSSAGLVRPDRDVPRWPIALMAAWSNLHPSILLGQFFLGVCLLQRFVHPTARRRRRNIFVLSAALLAGFINPYHFRLIPFSLFENRAYGYVTIREWLSPLSQLAGSWIDVVVLGVNTVMLVWLLKHFLRERVFSSRRSRSADMSRRNCADLIFLAGPCVFAITAYMAFRFMFLSTVSIMALTACAVARRPDCPGPSITPAQTSKSPAAAALALIGYFILLMIGNPTYSRDWFNLKRATAFLDSIQARGNIFNDFSFGGRIIYDCYPNLKVFADGRIGPFEDRVFAEYEKVFRGTQDEAMAVLDSYDIGWILIQETLKPDWMNRDAGFEEIYNESGIVILRRMDSKRADAEAGQNNQHRRQPVE